MAFITKYGSLWGSIPVTSGQVFWVSPSDTYTVEGRSYSASDDNDGLSPERALRRVSRAVALATASVNDVIVLLPGAHTVTASLALSKAGLTITGLPGGKGHSMKQRASLTTSAADEVINITAANVELAYLHIIGVTAQAAIDFSNAADFLYVHDCSFDMNSQTESTSTAGLVSVATSGGCSNLLVENCYWQSQGGTGPYLDVNDCVYGEVKGCTFRHTGSTALADGVVAATGALDIVFSNTKWVHGTAAIMTDAIDWTGTTIDASLQLIDCDFSQSTQVNASADNDVNVDLATAVMVIASGSTVQYPTYLNAG